MALFVINQKKVAISFWKSIRILASISNTKKYRRSGEKKGVDLTWWWKIKAWLNWIINVQASVCEIYCLFPNQDQLSRFINSLLEKNYIFLEINFFSSASPPASIQTDQSLRLSQSGPNIQSGNSISSVDSICTLLWTFRRHYCTLTIGQCIKLTAHCTLQCCLDIEYAKRYQAHPTMKLVFTQ